MRTRERRHVPPVSLACGRSVDQQCGGHQGRSAPAPAEPVATAIAPPPTPRRRWGVYASVAAVAAVLVAAAVVAVTDVAGHDHRTKGADAARLVGTVWRQQATGRFVGTNPSGTLYVDRRGRFVGDDECAIVGGTLDAVHGRLAAIGVVVRHRDCTDQYGARLGDGFASALAKKPPYSVNRRRLTIGEFHFVAAPGVPRPTADVPTFEEARWRLAAVRDGSGATVPTPPGAYLRVHAGRLTGRDGCNYLGGQVTRHGATVRAKKGSGAVTLMDCTPHRPGTVVVDRVLRAPFRATVRGVHLTVTEKGAGTLTYEWVPASPAEFDPAILVGPTWRLSGVAGAPATGHATLRFPSATTYEANDGCRAFRGTAKLSQGEMRLTGVPQPTAAGCPEQQGHQASTVDSFLGRALFAIRDGTLIVYGGGAQSFALVYAGADPMPAPSRRSTH